MEDSENRIGNKIYPNSQDRNIVKSEEGLFALYLVKKLEMRFIHTNKGNMKIHANNRGFYRMMHRIPETIKQVFL